MMQVSNGSISEETLQIALQYGIVDMEEISKNVELKKRNEILSQHPYKVWQNNQGIWLTYLPDEEKGRVFRKRKTREAIEDVIVDFYKKREKSIYIQDVFQEWVDKKLKYGEIQTQSYDRYCTDFKRFFLPDTPICRKKLQNITSADLTDFIKTTIHEKHLTKKTYSSLRTLIRGIFKYGKAQEYSTLSITEFFGDLELPNNIFEKKICCREDEIFSEDEIPIIVSYLKHHIDIWNMGLLLQFQTGMRIGEISALKPYDIHNEYIQVCRTEIKYKDEAGKWTVSTKEFAKTDAGNRMLYYSDTVNWTLMQIQKLNPHGEFLFMNNGKRIRENTFNKRLSSICDILQLNHRSTHKIRKTYGTTLLDNKVDDSTVAEQMGHSDIATTRKLYYFSNKSKETKIKQINEAINF